MGRLKLLGFASKGVLDRVFDVSHLLESADGDSMLFDIFNKMALDSCLIAVGWYHYPRRGNSSV